MAKFHGMIGYAKQYEEKPGVWLERIEEVEAFGEVINAFFGMNNSNDTTNDDLRLNNKISITGTSYAIENFQFMRYVTYMGVKWKITNVDVEYPRLILSIGGVYNA